MPRLFGASARPFADPDAPTRRAPAHRREAVDRVKQFWELASCGTDAGTAPPKTKAWFDEIERARYAIEPFIPRFANFGAFAGRPVLEIGVGAGTDFVQWCRAGALAHGVDLTAEAIENTRVRLELEGLSAELRQADAIALPYPRDHFDCVYSWGVLHHCPDTAAALREALRVTKPGGVLKVMLYNRHSLFAWYIWLRHGLPRGKSPAWAMGHFVESEGTTAYTPGDVRAMLELFPVATMRVSYWDQVVRPGARLRWLRQLASAVPRLRWFMGVEITKRAH